MAATNNTQFLLDLESRIRENAVKAKDRKTPLVIAIFSPVTPENDICVDFTGNQSGSEFLTRGHIKRWIQDATGDDDLAVVLVTPSPFTGGWVCYPSLFPREVEENKIQNLARFLASSCGAAFADNFMDKFTKRVSPLLTEQQRGKIRYQNMMPVGPTAEQTRLLEELQSCIHDSLRQQFCKLAKKHGFHFAVSDDAWGEAFPRSGFSILQWKHKWGIGDDTEIEDNPDRFNFLGEAFGGTRLSQNFHLRYLVSIELNTCPGDWLKNTTGITNRLFKDFIERSGLPDLDEFKRVFDAVEFRGSSIKFAGLLATALDLPTKASCRLWPDVVLDDDQYKKLQSAFGQVRDLFPDAPLKPGEVRNVFKDVRFYRPARWISCAIAMHFANGNSNDIKKFIEKEVVPLVEGVRLTQEALLKGHPRVSEMGKLWLRSLDLDIDTGPFQSQGKDKAPMAESEKTVQPLPNPVGRPEQKNPATEKSTKQDRPSLYEPLPKAQAVMEAQEPGPYTSLVGFQDITKAQESDIEKVTVKSREEPPKPKEEPSKPLADTWEAFYKADPSVPLVALPKRALKPDTHTNWKNFDRSSIESVADVLVDLKLGAKNQKKSIESVVVSGSDTEKVAGKLEKPQSRQPFRAIKNETPQAGSALNPLTPEFSPNKGVSVITEDSYVTKKSLAKTPATGKITGFSFATFNKPTVLETSAGLGSLSASVGDEGTKLVSTPASVDTTTLAARHLFDNLLSIDPHRMFELLRDLSKKKEKIGPTTTETPKSKAAMDNVFETPKHTGILGHTAAEIHESQPVMCHGVESPKSHVAAGENSGGVLTPPIGASGLGGGEAGFKSAGEIIKAMTVFGRGRLTPPQTPANHIVSQLTTGGTMDGKAELEHHAGLGAEPVAEGEDLGSSTTADEGMVNAEIGDVCSSKKGHPGSGPTLFGEADFWDKVSW